MANCKAVEHYKYPLKVIAVCSYRIEPLFRALVNKSTCYSHYGTELLIPAADWCERSNLSLFKNQYFLLKAEWVIRGNFRQSSHSYSMKLASVFSACDCDCVELKCCNVLLIVTAPVLKWEPSCLVKTASRGNITVCLDWVLQYRYIEPLTSCFNLIKLKTVICFLANQALQ